MRSIIFIIAAALTLPSVFAHADAPVDNWGPCPASPAVVNTPTPSPGAQIISLRGEWDFVTDARLMGRHRMGKGPEWNEPDWSGARKIEVPGCWEAQGVGEPGMSKTWDMVFDCIPRPLSHVYMGTARYRRTIDIPSDWSGKRIWLKVGGVRTEAWFWVNQHRVAHLNTYCGTYKYDITDFVTPGASAQIVATVRNDSPSRKGCMAAFHRFGGFYRDIEIEATPQTWIDDVWVRGDVTKGLALVNVSLRGQVLPNAAIDVAVKTLTGEPAGVCHQEIQVNADGAADVVCEVPIEGFQPWSPENPNLYLAEATLVSNGEAVHSWTERFGIRKLEARGDRFYLNGTPYFLRGYGDDYIYPLTLISPPDRQSHLRRLEIARRAGFNYVRHHTHCEIPEFFEAADEAGILIQPELPYYHDMTGEAFEFDPMRDLTELYRHYRRYVSFASYSLGNEGHLGSPIDKQLYQWAKANDPDRIYQHQDGGCNTRENSDYFSPNGYGLATSIVPWKPGTFDSVEVPFVAHEYLNLGIKMDPRTAPKFTGAIPAPRTMEAYEESLAKAGLDRAWGDACLNSAHTLQGYYQKRGLEQARRDPACDGYSFWTIIDVMVPQEGTYTGQGFLNAFWEEKDGGLSLDEFRRFNAPTVLLAQNSADSPIGVSGDKIEVALSISTFAPTGVGPARVVWTVKAGAVMVAEGAFEPVVAQAGEVKQIGACSFTVPDFNKPVHAVLEASIEGSDVSNAWDYWFFPKRAQRACGDVAVTDDLYDALSGRYSGLIKASAPEAEGAAVVVGSWDHPDLMALAGKGKRAMMIGPADGEPNVTLGWWSLGNQIGTAFKDHPVFGDFPHNGKLNALWFRLIKQGLPLPVDPQYGEFEHFAVGEGRTQYFTYVCQKKDDQGRTMLITRGVDLLNDTPEAAFLLDAMIDYVRTL